MVHKIYFYDSHVGTGRFLEFTYVKVDEIDFYEALVDFKRCLYDVLKDKRHLFIYPTDVEEDSNSNVIVDCNEDILNEVVKFGQVFFTIRGFVS